MAEVGLDLGKVLAVLTPHLPPVITARVDTTVNATTVHPRIQALGLMAHECSWWVADTRIAYGFNPSLMAQFLASHKLTISARLHVEVRKNIMGVIHKT